MTSATRSRLALSLRNQLILGVALVHAVLMTVFVFDLVERQREFLHIQGEKQAVSLSQTLAANSISWVLANDVIGLEEVLNALKNYPELRYAMVLSPLGKVLGHTERHLNGKFVVDPVSRRLTDHLPATAILVSDHQLLDVAAPILLQGELIGWARIGLGQLDNQAGLQLVTRKGLIYTLIAILIGAVFATLLSRGFTRRLNTLLEVVDAVRDGRRDLRAPENRNDELGRLADGFNRMLDALLKEEQALLQAHFRLSESRVQSEEITLQLRQSYESLQQERNKLHTIIHSIREGIVVTNFQGDIVLINPATEGLLQKNRDLIEADGFFNLADDATFMHTCLESGDDDLSHTLRYKGKDLHFFASTFREGGRAIGSLALIRDITEERKLKEQLHEIIAKAPFGIVVADDQEIIRVFNPKSSHLFGYETEEILGKPLTDLLSPTFRRRQEVELRHRFARGTDQAPKTLYFESEATHRDGSTFPIRMALNPMMLDGRDAMVCMIADMTEEKLLIDDLIRSEKMAGLGSMVAGVAHEINTPVGIGVTAVSELKERTQQFVSVLKSEGISEEELKEYLSSTTRLITLIQGNLERAADLVRSFKSVAVDQSSERLRTFRLREYVESTVLTMHHEFKNTKLSVLVQCEETLEIHSYPGVFSQIVINLFSNSLIHGFDPGEEGMIRIQMTVEGKHLRFTYQDDGHGMTEETCRRVFEPFYTTRRDRGGSGLGMHIVYNLVTQTLNGTISCQSSPGHGVNIVITMPLATPEGTQNPDDSPM
ncbi:MAG: PAS domain S-box protein [Magnetococcales bacterium]|nr:PAS domain S-box protein [Magnetococcales bacterium]